MREPCNQRASRRHLLSTLFSLRSPNFLVFLPLHGFVQWGDLMTEINSTVCIIPVAHKPPDSILFKWWNMKPGFTTIRCGESSSIVNMKANFNPAFPSPLMLCEASMLSAAPDFFALFPQFRQFHIIACSSPLARRKFPCKRNNS